MGCLTHGRYSDVAEVGRKALCGFVPLCEMIFVDRRLWCGVDDGAFDNGMRWRGLVRVYGQVVSVFELVAGVRGCGTNGQPFHHRRKACQ